MALDASKVPSKGGFNVEPLEPGTYPARVVQIIDTGLQAQQFKGEEKDPAREVFVTYEFVDEFMKDEDGNDLEDKPRWISERMPLHNLKSERAKSTQRYKALDPAGKYKGDFSKLVNVPCNVTIVQNKEKNGERIFENVANVSAMRPKDAQKCPALVNDPAVFDVDEPDMEIFNRLPNFIKERIKGNLEYEGSPLQQLVEDNPPPKKESEEDDLDDDDEVPY